MITKVLILISLVVPSLIFSQSILNDSLELEIVYYKNIKGKKGIYFADKKGEVIIDSSYYGKIKPDDLVFVNKNELIYHGNTLIKKTKNEFNLYRNNEVNIEQFICKPLLSNNYIVTSSFYFFDTHNTNNIYFYDKSFRSIRDTLVIEEDKVVGNLTSMSNEEFILLPKVIDNSKQSKVVISVVDVENLKIKNIDSINYSSELRYFNPRFIRNEKDYKLSLLKAHKINDNEIRIEILEYDYCLDKKKILFDFRMDYVKTDSFKHRIIGDGLFLMLDKEIFFINQRKEVKSILRTNNNQLLDFYVN